MASRRLLVWLLVAVLMVHFLTACNSPLGERVSSGGEVNVPEDIAKDFLAHPHFSTYKTEPSDLEWLVYSEEDEHRVVAATFKAKDRLGRDRYWYYLMAYEPETEGEAPKQLYGTLASIDDPDFDVSGFSVKEVSTPSGEPTLLLTASGFAGDPEVAKVVLETSEGRSLETTMYGRFWLTASEAVSSMEKVTRAVGYSQHGTRLYQAPPFVLAKGASPVSGPDDIPEDIIRNFYDRQAFATDVEWQLYIENDGERIAAATYTGVSKTGTINCYFLAVYSASGKPIRGAHATVDDSGFSVAASYFAADQIESRMPKIGYTSDRRVTRVVCETNRGQTVEATMYGPFWIAVIDYEPDERVTDIIGYDAEGNEIHHIDWPPKKGLDH